MKEKVIVWSLLLVCLAAIPIALNFRSGNPRDNTDEDKFGSVAALEDHIEVVHVSGMIADKADSPGLLPQIGSTANAKKKLRKALKNKHVKAVLLRINSPGGTVAASQELQQAVRELRDSGKLVVASLGDVAASGGYYVASAADRIIANPGTITGSIGVIMNLVNLQGIEEKLGIAPGVIKSGQFKDIGSPNRAMTADEKALLQSIIMDSYDQFVAAVATGRNMDEKVVRKLADGRIYSGKQAQALGLVDELAGYEGALASLQKLARERYKLDRDLPVHDSDSSGILSSLLDACAERLVPAGDISGVLPLSMRVQWQKLPLWIMQ